MAVGNTIEIWADTSAARDSLMELQAKLELRRATLGDVPDVELAEALKTIQQGVVMRAPKHGARKEFRPKPLTDDEAIEWARELKARRPS